MSWHKFVAMVCALFAACCSTVTPVVHVPAPTHEQQASTLRSETVALVHMREDGPHAYCAGVWVGPFQILTAQHCMDEDAAKDGVAFLTDGRLFPAGVMAQADPVVPYRADLDGEDPLHDLALLDVPDPPSHSFATVGLNAPKPGAFVQEMGHPFGMWWSYSSGDVSAVRQLFAGQDDVSIWIQTTVPTSMGNSGGGLFDSDGALVGVCHGSIRGGQNLNLFVHTQYIRAFLRARGVLI